MSPKYEKALKAIMKFIGTPYWCVNCEDWFKDGHFELFHIEKRK